MATLSDSLRFICPVTAGWYVVRCGHQQRGHRRQLRRMRVGAVHRTYQRSDGGV